MNGVTVSYPNDRPTPVTFLEIKDQSGCLSEQDVMAWRQRQSAAKPPRAAKTPKALPMPCLFVTVFHPDQVAALVGILREHGGQMTSIQLGRRAGMRASDCANVLAGPIRAGTVCMERVQDGKRTLTAFAYQETQHD